MKYIFPEIEFINTNNSSNTSYTGPFLIFTKSRNIYSEAAFATDSPLKGQEANSKSSLAIERSI